jgi:hypothetical protein
MEDFIKGQAAKFAKHIHAATRDYEKLINLQTRFDKELIPYTEVNNRLSFINFLEQELKSLFEEHLRKCDKVDTCPQHKTYNNAIFLITQSRSFFTTQNEIKIQNMISKNYLLDIFISHSSRDADIARALIELIRTALNIEANKIRCTSVSGYKLTVGVSTDDQLKKEIFDSKVFIGIISQNSLNSAYVSFELGARWGNELPLVPLITNKLGAKLLEGPLQNINALNSCIRTDVLQLITDLGNYLNKTPEQPSVYEDKVNALVELSLKDTLPTNSFSEEASPNTESREDISSIEDYKSPRTVIKEFCEKEWPDDYTMQLHCINQQEQALKQLKAPKPSDISENEFKQIRQKAARDWPIDYLMRLHEETQQIESLRQLRRNTL